MASETVLDLARRGDSRIIAALINRLTKPKGITAKVTILERCLHVLLESPHRLNQVATTTFIHQLIAQLDVQVIEQIKIYARQTGGMAIAWSHDVILHPHPALEHPVVTHSANEGDTASPEEPTPEYPEVGVVPSGEVLAPDGPASIAPEEPTGRSDPSGDAPTLAATSPTLPSDSIESVMALPDETAAVPVPATEAIVQPLPDPWDELSCDSPLFAPTPDSFAAGPPPIVEGDQVSSENQPQSTTQHEHGEPAPPEHPVTEADVVSSNPLMFDAELESPAPVPSPSRPDELPVFEEEHDDEISEQEISDLFQRPEAALLIIFAFIVALWDTYLDLIEAPGADQPMSGRELARRLGVNNSTISRRKDRPDFGAWAQDLDPDGIAWNYQEGMFIPHPPVEETAG